MSLRHSGFFFLSNTQYHSLQSLASPKLHQTRTFSSSPPSWHNFQYRLDHHSFDYSSQYAPIHPRCRVSYLKSPLADEGTAPVDRAYRCWIVMAVPACLLGGIPRFVTTLTPSTLWHVWTSPHHRLYDKWSCPTRVVFMISLWPPPQAQDNYHHHRQSVMLDGRRYPIPHRSSLTSAVRHPNPVWHSSLVLRRPILVSRMPWNDSVVLSKNSSSSSNNNNRPLLVESLNHHHHPRSYLRPLTSRMIPPGVNLSMWPMPKKSWYGWASSWVYDDILISSH